MTCLIVRWLGLQDYLPIWQAMRRFTASRTLATPDEIWLLEHPPVYTAGVRARLSFRRPTGTIAAISTDRGGLLTYHGPGQLIAYTLLDLARLGLTIRDLVSALEQATVDLLKQYGIWAHTVPQAPGVYVGEAKIASLGLRVKNARSYHGLSLNVDLDLAPFEAIDPCGIQGLKMTRLADFGVLAKVHEIAIPWLACLLARLKKLPEPQIVYELPLKESEDVH